MTDSKALKLSGEESRQLALRVREELARRRMTREALADAAKISISTLEKVLAGKRSFTLATIVRLEEGLGARLLDAPASVRQGSGNGRGNAPDDLGGYNRTAVSWLEGAYLTLRPSFSEASAIYAYRTDISWAQATDTLQFREAERIDHDYTQFGSVAVPHQSGHIYLVTNRHGQHRLIVVARPTIGGELHGILTTLQSGKGSHLSPVSMPIVLKLLKANDRPHYGRIPATHAAHGRYAALLKRTLDDQFAAFLPG
jgi:transcriptional regulator with XRE-family HTH domain